MQNTILESYLKSIGLTYERLTKGLDEETRSDFDRIIDNKTLQGGLTFDGALRTIKFLKLEERVISVVNEKIKVSYIANSFLYAPMFLLCLYITLDNKAPPPIRLVSGIYLSLLGYISFMSYTQRKLYRKVKQILNPPNNSSQNNTQH